MKIVPVLALLFCLTINGATEDYIKENRFLLMGSSLTMIGQALSQIVEIGYTRGLTYEVVGAPQNSTVEYGALFSMTSAFGNVVALGTTLPLLLKNGQAVDDNRFILFSRGRRFMEGFLVFKNLMSFGLQAASTFFVFKIFVNPPDQPTPPSLLPSMITSVISAAAAIAPPVFTITMAIRSHKAKRLEFTSIN